MSSSPSLLCLGSPSNSAYVHQLFGPQQRITSNPASSHAAAPAGMTILQVINSPAAAATAAPITAGRVRVKRERDQDVVNDEVPTDEECDEEADNINKRQRRELEGQPASASARVVSQASASISAIGFQIINGQRQGKGVEQTQSGFLHVSYQNGKRQGKATEIFNNDSRIECEYVDGERQGDAKHTFRNGTIQFKYVNDKRQGDAKHTFTNGTIQFKYVNGEREGDATMTYNSGNVVKFKYVNGECEGDATETHIDGSVAKFKYVGGKVSGSTKRIFIGGAVLEHQEGLSEAPRFYTYYDPQLKSRITFTAGQGAPVHYVDSLINSFLRNLPKLGRSCRNLPNAVLPPQGRSAQLPAAAAVVAAAAPALALGLPVQPQVRGAK